MRTIVYVADLVTHANRTTASLRSRASVIHDQGGLGRLLEADSLLSEAQAIQRFVHEVLSRYAINTNVEQTPAQAGEATNESVEESDK